MSRKVETPGRVPAVCGAILVLLLVVLVPAAQACSIPGGGCTATKCAALAGLNPPSGGYSYDVKIGFYYGIFNNNTALKFNESQRGGAYVNWEVFPTLETAYWIVDTASKSVTTLSGCCTLCAQTPSCVVYQFYTNINPLAVVNAFTGRAATKLPTNWPTDATLARQCYLLTGGTDNTDPLNPDGAPPSGSHSYQKSTTTAYAPSWVGGHCNGSASVINDPHFTGALGTRFEFNGDIDKTFCLVTDTRLHINMKLGGFEDGNTFGATVLKNGKALRTWIREVGILWNDSDGSKHTALLVSRRGKQQEHGGGFITSFIVDGAAVPAPRVPGEKFQKGDLSFQLDAITKKGPYDLERHTLVINGLMELGLDLRPAHPLLQTKNDAQVHFNIIIRMLRASDNVHGVLGQTYRRSATQTFKALEYSLLARLMGKPVVADGDSGFGFLDGTPKDYQTSGSLSADSLFSSYAL